MCIPFRFSTSKAKGQKHTSVRMAGCMRHLQVCFSMFCLVCVQGMSSVLTMIGLVQFSLSASDRKVRANCRAPCDDS